MTELLVREYRPGDEARILETFNRVFAAVDPTFRPRTLERWRWQFAENPAGSLILVAVTDEGEVAGQLANMLQRVRLGEREVVFSQAVDSMSDPALRRGLRRESLQARLGNTYAETWAGEEPGQHFLLWGTPVPAAWRVGKRFIRYEVVRTQLELVCRPIELLTRLGTTSGGGGGALDVEVTDRFPGDVDELFERAAPDHGAIAVRDRATLDWRFHDHPEQDYAVALARRDGELAGYAVARAGTFGSDAMRMLVCDWLVPAADREAARALLGWLAVHAREAGEDELAAVLPDRCPEWRLFQEHGFRAAPTPYAMVGRQCVRGYDMRWMNAHWYYTLGDTDLA